MVGTEEREEAQMTDKDLTSELTPGPWEAITPCPGECCWHIQPVGNEQGPFGYINGPEMSEADAKLCAIAPELLVIVSEILAWWEDSAVDADWPNTGARIRKALTQIRGYGF